MQGKWIPPYPKEKPKQRRVEGGSRLHAGVPYPTLESIDWQKFVKSLSQQPGAVPGS